MPLPRRRVLRAVKRELKGRVVAPWETRRALAGRPVSAEWRREAVRTQARLTRVHADVPCRARIGAFEVESLSADMLAFLHKELFVHLAYYFPSERSDPVIVDGGSNIGVSVAFFKSLYPNARILAFEPSAKAYQLLARNVGETTGVELHRLALGRESGFVPFYEDDDPGLLRQSVKPERLRHLREAVVEQRRLSEFIEEDVALVKLDVEGAEDDVLADLVESGAIAHVRRLVVEYHHQMAGGGDGIDGFLATLRAAGFAFQLTAREDVRYRDSAKPIFQDVLVYAHRPRSGDRG